MYKLEEQTFMFSKNDIIEALEKNFGISGSLVEFRFGPYNVKDDDPDFLMLKTRQEYGTDQIRTDLPMLVEEGSLD